MNKTAPLLIEIGAEEIPAFVAPKMCEELGDKIDELLQSAKINVSGISRGVTPRRLLIHIDECPVIQEDREETIWGPPEKVAFDSEGKPTKAAEGFAKKSGLNISDFELADKPDSKGLYMKAVQTVKGRKVADIIAEAMPSILRKLPSPKQMRWNDGENRDDAFIRPVRWIVARLGDEVIPFSFAGVKADKLSRGHRIPFGEFSEKGSRGPKELIGEINIEHPLGWLYERYVIAKRQGLSPSQAATAGFPNESIGRLDTIKEKMDSLAKDANLTLVDDEQLFEEVADLTEWPAPILCEFDEGFLRLPREVIQITLRKHQRCFITCDKDGMISNKFIAVANIESKDPSQVAQGNARVVNARLADAAFYFERDPKKSPEDRVEKLNEVVFQEGLGMIGDQVRRLRGFALDNANALGVDANDAQRAAYLCKSDLTTGLVGEFPELQGYMGGIYARLGGENEYVAQAISEHYHPMHAGDKPPKSPIARAIAVAERADKLLGYFHLGRVPTASADPYGLRRAAMGLILLLADEKKPVKMSLKCVLREAAKQWNQQRVTIAISDKTLQQVESFIAERMSIIRVRKSAIEAAFAAAIDRPVYQHAAVARLLAGFADSETGQAVAAANKRIANILKKAELKSAKVDAALFAEDAESALFNALQKAEAGFPEEPEAQLEVLAGLREPVDQFFDDVMVMADDEKLRNNRLALLARLRELFLKLADISRL